MVTVEKIKGGDIIQNLTKSSNFSTEKSLQVRTRLFFSSHITNNNSFQRTRRAIHYGNSMSKLSPDDLVAISTPFEPTPPDFILPS